MRSHPNSLFAVNKRCASAQGPPTTFTSATMGSDLVVLFLSFGPDRKSSGLPWLDSGAFALYAVPRSTSLHDAANMRHSRLCAVLIVCQTFDVDAASRFWGEALGRPVDLQHPATRGNYRMLA